MLSQDISFQILTFATGGSLPGLVEAARSPPQSGAVGQAGSDRRGPVRRLRAGPVLLRLLTKMPVAAEGLSDERVSTPASAGGEVVASSRLLAQIRQTGRPMPIGAAKVMG